MNNNTVNPNTKLYHTKNKDIVLADMDGESVLLSIENGSYFGFNGLGTRIFELLEQPASISELCELITAEYDVDSLTCEKDITKFVDELLQKGLVSIL